MCLVPLGQSPLSVDGFCFLSGFGSRQKERKSGNPHEHDLKTWVIYCYYLKHTQLPEPWEMSVALWKQMKSLWLSNRTGFFKAHK